MPKIFNDVVISELKSNNRETRYRACKKFAVFWKLTAKEKNYIPFISKGAREQAGNLEDEEVVGELFGGLKPGSANAENKDKQERSQEAIHYMLDFLQDPDPSMRMTCRSWL